MGRASWVALIALIGAVFVPPGNHAAATSATRVFLNGVPTPVYFNDGDSFRVLEGPLRDTKARLAGFNTLETFGPAHQWGTWDAWELLVVAKMGRLNAVRGTWHCNSADLARDTYGRILWDCPDLAVDQIRKGLAHAMMVNHEPSRIEYLRAQRLAIAERRGMWAHGVPDFVMTSIHSADEDPNRDRHYNRLVSTEFGHSESHAHRDTYSNCQLVCNEETHVEPARVDAGALALRSDAAFASRIVDLDNLRLRLLVSMFARTDTLPDWTPEALRADLTQRLSAMKANGDFGALTQQRGSCGLHVPFEQRYRRPLPSCLVHP